MTAIEEVCGECKNTNGEHLPDCGMGIEWGQIFQFLRPEIRFIACNNGGTWRGYAERPEPETREYIFACGSWVNQGGLHISINGIKPFPGRWTNSLIERAN